jgi:hypothetical protein
MAMVLLTLQSGTRLPFLARQIFLINSLDGLFDSLMQMGVEILLFHTLRML